MTTRALQADATRERILDAAALLMKTHFRSDMRLDDVATEAGVTVQTILNKFGSKAELLDQALRRFITQIAAGRRSPEPGDTVGAIQALYDHYEDIGELVIRNLMEAADPELAEIGRRRHREWVELYFGADLPRGDLERACVVDALVACCDVYNWKLLRRDLGRSREEAQAVVLLTVRALLARPQPKLV